MIKLDESIPQSTQRISDFYQSDAISQALPYKNLMNKVKLPNDAS